NVNPLFFTLTNANPTVSSAFTTLGASQYALTAESDGFGKVAVTPRANAYTSGANVTLTAIADAGQSFSGWAGDASWTHNPVAMTTSERKIITANFTKRPTLRVGTLLEGFADDGFRFTLIGEFGAQYEVFASFNLTTWLPIAALTNLYGTTQVSDPGATNQSYL